MNAYTPPPAQPLCVDEEPSLFDVEFTYGMALAICQNCPVREWCLNQVDPARSYYDGVAGGVVWREGIPNPKWTDVRRDVTLIDYLARRGQLKKLN